MDAIDQAIALLEAERVQVDEALEALRRVRHSRDGARRPEKRTTLSPAPSKPLSDDDTNETAVDTVLRLTGGGLTTSEIVNKSAELGKELNKNSVRWTLSHGVDDGKYLKKKDDRVNRYWLVKHEE